MLAGTAGSAATDVACSVRSTGAGAYRVSFRLATLEPGQRVDDSNESIAVAGTLPAVGQELVGADGSIVFRGFGFTITRATLGPSGTCHVFVDQVSGESLRGRFACADAPDDAVPPRSRSVRGLVPATASDDWGEFRFDHCDRE